MCVLEYETGTGDYRENDYNEIRDEVVDQWINTKWVKGW